MHGEGTRRIRERFPEVEVVEVPLEGELDPGLRGDALLCRPAAATTAELAGRVQWVHNHGTGLDRLPDEAFGAPVLTCSRGAGAIPISEFVLATMLAFEKQLPDVWLSEPPARWNAAGLGSLYGKTLGLIGIGGIGGAVARRALPFGMEVVGFRRHDAPPPLPEIRVVRTLEQLLPVSDHLVVAAPLTARTRRLLDADALTLVRPGVHLVNIA